MVGRLDLLEFADYLHCKDLLFGICVLPERSVRMPTR